MVRLNTKASDWCTAWPDRWKTYDYSACCQKHDEEYADPTIDRWSADINLFDCVRKNSTFGWALLMFIGVRSFGWMFKHYVPKSK